MANFLAKMNLFTKSDRCFASNLIIFLQHRKCKYRILDPESYNIKSCLFYNLGQLHDNGGGSIKLEKSDSDLYVKYSSFCLCKSSYGGAIATKIRNVDIHHTCGYENLVPHNDWANNGFFAHITTSNSGSFNMSALFKNDGFASTYRNIGSISTVNNINSTSNTGYQETMIIIAGEVKTSSTFLNGHDNTADWICLNFFNTPSITASHINYIRNSCTRDHVQIHIVGNAEIRNLIFKENNNKDAYSVIGHMSSCNIYDSYIDPLYTTEVNLDSLTTSKSTKELIPMTLFRSNQCYVYTEITDVILDSYINSEMFITSVFITYD